jgi:hypothetical protein
MRHREVVLVALVLSASHARAQDETATAVQNYVDQTGVLQAFLYFDPIGTSAFVRGSEGNASYGGSLSFHLLRIGKQWGRGSVGATQLWLMGGDAGLGAIASIDSIAWDVQYQCRDPDGNYQFVYPLMDILAPVRNCNEGELLAWGARLAEMRFRPEVGHIALRLLEGSLALNAFATGRTERAYGEQLVFRFGGSVDYVDFGDVARPANTGNSDWAGRGLVSAHLVLSTVPTPYFRFAASVVWRPRFGEWEDQQIEGTLDFIVHLAVHRDVVLALTLRGGAAYASWPWTTTSTWADPASTWSLLGQLALDVYWGST